MISSVTGISAVGQVAAMARTNRGVSVDEAADMALGKLVEISDQAPMPIREQARAYREQVRALLYHYIAMAVDGHTTTLAGKLREAGYPELADQLRNL